jgi:hypothetical protein
LIYWYDDITLNAFAASNGLIVSPALKQLLEKFNLGNHKFYETQVSNIEKADEKKTFYLFHSMTDISSITDYEQSEYCLTDYNTQSEVKKEIGLFKSYADLKKANDEYFKKNMGLRITKRSVNTELDVIYGFTNNLIVNERIKVAVESSGIKGVKLKPFREIASD